MARSKNKKALLDLGQENYKKLCAYIEKLSPEEQNQIFPIGTLNRNISDVLMHLHHWNLLMISWYETGMKGEKPDMPAKGYTWKTMPELNKWIQNKYR